MEHLRNDYEKAEYLQNILINHATSDGDSSDDEYKLLRNYFLQNHTLQDLLPECVRTKRSLKEFWNFIKYKFAHYSERRDYIWKQFNPLLDFLERQSSSSKSLISDTLKLFDLSSVHSEWQKAIKRQYDDPEGAITMAKTLLESVCKHILEEQNIQYSDKVDITDLYKKVSHALKLAPVQHQEEIFKQILSGCNSIVNGLAALRNKLGDSHGQGKRNVKPKKRHAELAVNLAGTMAVFLISTYQDIDLK